MFHGLAWRRDKYGAMAERYYTDSALIHPLLIVRNASNVPAFSFPGHNPVVSPAMKERLSDFPSVGFFPVVHFRLFEYPYASGDFSYEDDPMWRRINEIAGDDIDLFEFSQRNDWDLHERLGTYYELLGPSPRSLQENYPEAKELNMAGGHGLVSEKMLRENPIVRARGGVFLNDAAFEVFRPHLDPDYFGGHSVDVSLGTHVDAPLQLRIVSTLE